MRKGRPETRGKRRIVDSVFHVRWRLAARALRRALGGGGVLVNVFLLRIVDANERLDRLDDALCIAHEVLIDILHA